MQLSRVISSVNRLASLRGIQSKRAVFSPFPGAVDLTSRTRYLLIVAIITNNRAQPINNRQ